MTLRKFYFSRDRQRCLEGGHYFTVVRKTYVHPNSIPDGMVRKIIWQACTAEGYARLRVISDLILLLFDLRIHCILFLDL